MGNPSLYQKTSGIEKKIGQNGDIAIFCRIFFGLTVEKKFEAEPCSVSQSFVYHRSFCIKVGYHEFPSISLSLSIENFCTGTPQCFKNFRVSRSFMHKKWVSRISLEYFSSHSAEFF